jgi:hypothetical protein
MIDANRRETITPKSKQDQEEFPKIRLYSYSGPLKPNE